MDPLKTTGETPAKGGWDLGEGGVVHNQGHGSRKGNPYRGVEIGSLRRTG